MAKKSMIAKNEQRALLVAQYAQARRELKALISSTRATAVQRARAQSQLQAMPRDASATRYRRRDAGDGRPRGHLRKFGLSRIRMRQMAHAGELPGVRRSSW